MKVNSTFQNFAYGEISPFARGRFDTPMYANSCRKLENFMPEVSGALDYRPGFKSAGRNSRGKLARYEPFVSDENNAFILEFTHQRIRVLLADGAVFQKAATAITDITFNPSDILVESTGHGLLDGQRVYLSGIVGTTELNGRYFDIEYVSANAFKLLDIKGGYISPTGLTAYDSGGSVVGDYEISVRYREADLFGLQLAKSGNTAYIAHSYYDIQQLVYDPVALSWTAGDVTLTNDPFTVTDNSATLVKGAQTVLVTTAVFTTVAHVQLEDVGSTTPTGDEDWEALSGTRYLVKATATPGQYYLKNEDGSYLDTSGYSTHTTINARAVPLDKPVSCAFYENRLVFGGTFTRPATVFMSCAPDSTTGASKYLDFTGGTGATDALFFTLSPVNGRWDAIQWLSAGISQLLVGTYGGVTRVTGGGQDEPITPTSINAKPSDAYGSEGVLPVAVGRQTYFVQRGGRIIRGYNYEVDAYEATLFDATLPAEHITVSGIKQIAYQTGSPDVLWAVRNDGVLLSASINLSEKVIAWARHSLGGDGKVVSVAVVPSDDRDRVWICVERTIDGAVQHYAEILTEKVAFPDREDCWTGDAEDDDLSYRKRVYALQNQYTHLDGFSTFDGSDRGVAVSATLTPAAVTGDSVVFTASQAVFTAADVGNEIRKSSADGAGWGRAIIIGYTDTTHVTCRIISDFDSASAVPAGDWYITGSSVSGLDYLEGATVSVVADGAYLGSDFVVINGTIALGVECAVAHVGFEYTGFVQTHSLEMGGVSGPSQSKAKNIIEIGIRFLYTLGGLYGTDLYGLEQINSWNNSGITGTPAPVFSGVKRLPITTSWKRPEEEATVYFVQDKPLPCTIQFLDVFAEVNDD